MVSSPVLRPVTIPVELTEASVGSDSDQVPPETELEKSADLPMHKTEGPVSAPVSVPVLTVITENANTDPQLVDNV